MSRFAIMSTRRKFALLAVGWGIWLLVSGFVPNIASADPDPTLFPPPAAPASSDPGCVVGEPCANPPAGPAVPGGPISNPPTAPAPGGGPSANPPVAPGSGPTIAGQNGGVQLLNPLKNINSIPDLLAALLNVFIILVTPIIIFFIMLAGYKYVAARGVPGELTKAKDALLYAVIGAVLILGATAITQILKNLVNAFLNTPTP